MGVVYGHSGRQGYLKLPGHQHHFRPGGTAGLCQRHAHAAAGQVGDAAHGVDGFKGGAGREQHAFAGEQFGRPQIGQQFGQFGGFEHAAFAGFAAGLATAGGAEHGDAVGLQLGDVAQVGRVAPHFHVHGGGNGQRAGAGGGQGGEQVVGHAVGDFGQGVGAGGGDKEYIGLAAEADVRHAVGGVGSIVRPYSVPAQGLEGLRRNETGSGAAHSHAHGVPLFSEQAHEFAGFVGGNAAADAEQDVFGGHGVWRDVTKMGAMVTQG